MNRLDGADAPYWHGLAEGRLLLPRCGGCDRWMWPAGHRCGQCGNSDIRWIEREPRGTTFSWTRTWHRFGLTEALELPFATVLAEIDECGVRLLGLLDDPGRIDPRIGENLVGRFGQTTVGDDRIPTLIWSRT
ncbi:Zn-ribbon domain-containing OB-fold protein [Novosphingobium sp. Gsoil 351]|uniref:Zn-ribbon domain-containing OB-fold protein n=1 Tax=Novosphingobium sp. Gsoil 351 TaxID=2675225 RepID=UPI0012B4B5FB|nr:zinc ribbon domain-containing protein [Novosphingobium sp. Gsoil 351]QGN54618.1 DNA-binding protein [Novosphingobium sp. Gsoil 351]